MLISIIIVSAIIVLIRFGVAHLSSTSKPQRNTVNDYTSYKYEPTINEYNPAKEDKSSIIPPNLLFTNKSEYDSPNLDNFVAYHNKYTSDEKNILKIFLFAYDYDVNKENNEWDKNVYYAVVDFQNTHNLIADGKIGKSTLLKMSEIMNSSELDKNTKSIFTKFFQELVYRSYKPKKKQTEKYVSNPSKKIESGTPTIQVPLNAHISGNFWFCDNGYQKVGNRCFKLEKQY